MATNEEYIARKESGIKCTNYGCCDCNGYGKFYTYDEPTDCYSTKPKFDLKRFAAMQRRDK